MIDPGFEPLGTKLGYDLNLSTWLFIASNENISTKIPLIFCIVFFYYSSLGVGAMLVEL